MQQDRTVLRDQILEEALALHPAEQRAFLARACANDAELRGEIERLLRLDRDMRTDFLAPAGAVQPISAATEGATVAVPELANGDLSFEEAITPDLTFDRYRILRVIGEGGMGKVYLAEQTQPVRRTVALKIIRPGMHSKDVIARFETERQVLAMMDHPNIAKVLDAGSTNSGQPYFVMELVDGPPITDYSDDHRLTIRERLNLFIPVCRAVQHAHQKGIIHRDIKPSNILVPTYDGRPVPKVIDFGIAKATEQTAAQGALVTRMGAIVGTFAYMSPEQADSGSRDVDTRSDVYSLGAVLYELLTGATPIEIDHLIQAGYLEMVRRIREEEPPPPSSRLVGTTGGRNAIAERRKTDPNSLERTVHGDLDWIVMRALEKDPARRYATANGFLRDLERYLNGEPVEAGPVSAAYRFQKFIGKHRVLLATVSAFLALLVVSASVSIWQAVRANRERDRAVAALHVATAEKLAIPAMESLSTDPERSILLAMHAVNATTQFHEPPTPAAEGALHAAILSSRIRAVLRGHTQDVRALAFSRDGTHIVTGGDDGLIKIWEAATGRELLSFRGRGAVSGVAFSPDGTRIATANPDRTATIWNAATGAEVLSFHGHEHSAVTAVAFNPDGTLLATSSLDRTARLWDTATGRAIRVFRGHAGGVWCVAFSPDWKRLATASEDGTARVWDTSSGRPLITLRGHQRPVVSVAFDRDGKRIATGSADRTAKVWDVESARALLTVTDETSVTWVSFSPDGRWLATAGSQPKIWDWQNGRQLFAFPDRAMSKLAFDSEGRRLAVATPTHAVNVYSTGPGVEIKVAAMETGAGEVLTPDITRLVSVSREGAKVWDVASGRLLLTIPSPGEPISDVKFSPDGSRLAISSYDGTARVYDLSGRELIIFRGHQDKATGVVFSPDGRRIATSSADKTARLWDVSTGRQLTTLSGHQGSVVDVAFSPDGNRIATASNDGTAKIWDATGGKLLSTLVAHRAGVWTVLFSPDGERLATLGWDRPRPTTGNGFCDTVRVWSVAAGTEQFAIHSSTIAIAFSPDGSRLATGARDTLMWNARTGQYLFILPAAPNDFKDRRHLVRSLRFSRDGTHLTVSDFGLLKTYALDISELMAIAKSRVTRVLTAEECQTYFQSPVCPALP